jgi:hypothetical protein
MGSCGAPFLLAVRPVLHDDSNQSLSCLCFAIGSGDDRLGFAVRQRLEDVGLMIVLGR